MYRRPTLSSPCPVTPRSHLLTQELRHLEEIGLVARTELDDAHRRVRYALTPKGRSLTEILGQVYLWAVEHHGSDSASAA